MNYYENTEEIDNSYLIQFNNDIKWFTTMTRNNLLSVIDWTCEDKKGRTINVELKTRSIDIFKYDTIFIEERKFNTLLSDWNENNTIPLYINFFQNGDNIAIFDLRNYDCEDLEKKMIHIYDKGSQSYKNEYRILLPTRSCIYYQRENNKLIRKW